jgi:hypothetical protein
MEIASTIWIVLLPLIVLLFFIFRCRKILGLNVVKWLYGKYSYEFLVTYKKLFVRSPFQYCFRDEFLSHVLFVLDKRADVPLHKTHSEIMFEGQPFLIPYKEFLKKKGKPYCFNAFSFDHPHFIIKVLGYLENVSDQKVIAAYYFFDDIFFMGEYIFKKPSDEVKEKYIQPYYDLNSLQGDNFYIENTRKRIIHYQNNGISIDVKYLTREDNRILHTLKEYHDHMTKRELVVEV